MTIEKTIRYLSYSIIIALVYFGFWLLVKPFLLPPTYAAPVWPSAGVGVGVLLLFGYRYIPALMIGEFFINYHFYKFDNLSDNPHLLYTYIILLLSTVLRSFLGAYLVKIYVGPNNHLLTLRSILKLFIFSAMIPVTFTAFISTYTLTLSGLLDPELFFINYSAWWYGDNVGTYIILPLMLVLFKKPKRIWFPRFYKTFIPVLVSFILLIVIALKVKTMEGERIKKHLGSVINNFSEQLLANFSSQMKTLHGLEKKEAIKLLDEFFIQNAPKTITSNGIQDVFIAINSGNKNIFESSKNSTKLLKPKLKHGFTFFDQNWEFEISATSVFYKNNSSWLIWWLLSLGFLFIASLEAGLLVITGNSIHINERVKKRTHEIKLLNDSLKASEEKYKQMIEIQPVIIWRNIVGENKLDFLSEEAENITGYTRKELFDIKYIKNHIIDKRDVDRVIQIYFDGSRSLKQFETEYRIKHKDGSIIWFKDYVTPHYNSIDDTIELIGVKIDTTKEQKTKQKIQQLAYYDSMTKLPNRLSFMQSLSHAIRKSETAGTLGAILYLDLDRFKVLNDSMGHYFGDELLKKIAIRLNKILRKGDVCSRFGGDEFVILMQNKDTNIVDFEVDIKTVTDKIQSSMKKHFLIKGYNFYTSFSIGVSIFPHYSRNPVEIIQQGDIAMYTSKSRGNGEVSFFKETMQIKANNLLRTEEFLKRAVLKDEFEMYYQPIFNKDKKICRLEALIRWHHPEDGLVMPNDFIKIAEESGVIVSLNEWIFKNVFKMMGQRQQDGLTLLPVSINVSLFQFRYTKIVEVIQTQANKYGVDTNLITLELTESIAMDDFDEAINKLINLKKIGIKLAIDDFGSGYSSMKYLTKMPIDMLKIDKSFIHNLHKKNSTDVIVEMIIKMALKLELDIVAEGVENNHQLEVLTTMGCQYFQGFLVNKALPYEDLKKFI